MSLVFKPESHEYFYKGVRAPGVTETLGACVKSFYGPEAETARQFGTALHKTIALIEKGKRIAFDSQLAPFILQWEKFKFAFSGMKIIEIETPLYSDKYQYAGTPDILAEYRGQLILIDLKSGAPSKLWELQTAAYWQLFKEIGKRPDKIYCVQLEQTGFKLFDYSKAVQLNFTIFLSFLNVTKWKLKNNLK